MLSGNELLKARADAVLQEVQFIRQEILDNISRVFKVKTSSLLIFGTLISIALHDKEPQILIIGPIVSWALVMFWVNYQRHLDISSKYLLEEIEADKWPILIGTRNNKNKSRYKNLWVSWQHYHDEKKNLPSVRMSIGIAGAIWFFGALLGVLGFWINVDGQMAIGQNVRYVMAAIDIFFGAVSLGLLIKTGMSDAFGLWRLKKN
jgi:hypothetical protein